MSYIGVSHFQQKRQTLNMVIIELSATLVSVPRGCDPLRFIGSRPNIKRSEKCRKERFYKMTFQQEVKVSWLVSHTCPKLLESKYISRAIVITAQQSTASLTFGVPIHMNCHHKPDDPGRGGGQLSRMLSHMFGRLLKRAECSSASAQVSKVQVH